MGLGRQDGRTCIVLIGWSGIDLAWDEHGMCDELCKYDCYEHR